LVEVKHTVRLALLRGCREWKRCK